MPIGTLLKYSILIGGVIAAVRFRQIKSEYRPFIYVVWLACLNEFLSDVLRLNGYHNYASSDIYSLSEGLLYLWFFRNLGVFKHLQSLFYFLIVLFTGVWTSECLFYNVLTAGYCSYFNIVYSMVIVLLSIQHINSILVREREILLNPAFLICIGCIIFFTYSVMLEVFWLYGLGTAPAFAAKVFTILSWVNFISNVIYALAVLWMRKKQAFTMQY